MQEYVPMKRILILCFAVGFFAAEARGQQSSRKTRPIPTRVAHNTAETFSLKPEEQAGTQDKSAPPATGQTLPTATALRPYALQETSVLESDDPPPILSMTQMQPPAPQSPPQMLPTQILQAQMSPGQSTSVPRPPVPMVTSPAATIDLQSQRSVSTRIIAPAEINIGQATDIRVITTNHGQQAIGPFDLEVFLPEEATFANSEPPAVDQGDSRVTWEMQGLAAGQSLEVRFQMFPQSRKPMFLRTELKIVDRQEFEVMVRQPVVRMALESMEKAIVGQPISHQLTIWNEGDGVADDLLLQVALPSEMKLEGVSGNTVAVGPLAPGETRQVTLQTRSTHPGELPIVWNLTGNGVQVAHDSQISVVWPELYAELLGPKVNIPNRDANYSIQVNNPCDIAISDTRVTLQIPEGMKVTVLSRPGKVDNLQRTITWDLGSLPPGGSDTLQFKAQLTGNQNQTCQVVVESRETESNLLALETRAYQHTELKLSMKNTSGPVNVGETAAFKIVAANTGHMAASAVGIEVEYPQWLKPVPDSRYTIDAQNSRLIFQNIDIPEGMAAEFQFLGVCETAGNYMVRSFLNHESQGQPMISDASLFVLDSEQEKVGSVMSPEKTIR